jgi:hypothetical protein
MVFGMRICVLGVFVAHARTQSKLKAALARGGANADCTFQPQLPPKILARKDVRFRNSRGILEGFEGILRCAGSCALIDSPPCFFFLRICEALCTFYVEPDACVNSVNVAILL